MPEAKEMQYNNSNESIDRALSPLLPPQPMEFNIPKPEGPSALQRLAALAAAIAAQDQNVQADSDSDADDSDSDSDNDSDTDADTDTDSDSGYSDYWSLDMPFRMRTASTPAAIGGQQMLEAAQSAMRRLLAQRMARRSVCCIADANY